jgi:hypothetical protein
LLVPVERIELPTFGLQNRCSTAELNRLKFWYYSINCGSKSQKIAICYRFATQSFRPLVYCSLQRSVNTLGSILLHSRKYVAVEVERDPDLGMAEPFAGDFRMDAVRQHVSGVRMTQVMEADAGQGRAFEFAEPVLCDGVRL